LARSIDAGIPPALEEVANMNARRTLFPRQRGVSMLGLLFWAVLIGFVAYVGMRVLPTLNEYSTIKRLVERVAAAAPASVPEARNSYDKLKEVEFSVQSVEGKDLEITKEGEKVVIKFAYTKEIPLVGPTSLLIRYAGQTR
jgi:Domain of unknown function (DUF4845)